MSGSKTHFGDLLRHLREMKNKSQREMAKEIRDAYGGDIRISQATLSMLEQSELAPKEEVLQILAHYFDIPITYFFDDSTPDERERVERAKAYLKQLRAGDIFYFNRTYAHSENFRRDGDELQRKLENLTDPDDEYLNW